MWAWVSLPSQGWSSDFLLAAGLRPSILELGGSGSAFLFVFGLRKTTDPQWNKGVPVSSDAQQYASVLRDIRDQSLCGSCWAFGSTEFEAVHRYGQHPDDISRGHHGQMRILLVFSMSCNRGQPGRAWQWFKDTCVVIGRDNIDVDIGTTCVDRTRWHRLRSALFLQ